MTDTLQVTRDGRVAMIRLNRPEALNALNLEMTKNILKVAEPLDADESVGCIVLTGNEKAFAAGADIKEMKDRTYPDMLAKNHFDEWEQFGRLRTPKIAAVNGFALGGGCELAMLCDFIISGEGAKFGQPEIKLGVTAGIGGTQRLTRAVGKAKSMDLNLTGRMMDAAEALDCGLVARVVPDDKVVDEAMEAAATIASYSKPVTQIAREAVMRSDEMSLAEGLMWERRIFYSLFATEDQKEGMAAFAEKRKPNFKHR
ncbi:MAG: enoyl-CoA hydratase-related protein [Pseudomonadota bacterium]